MTTQRYPITPTQTLPARPSLEQLKKQAKDLLKAVKSGDASVCPVLRHHVRFADSPDETILGADLSLQEVQHVVALQLPAMPAPCWERRLAQPFHLCIPSAFD